MPAEEQDEIVSYLEETSVEAEDPMQAYRRLAKKAAGTLSRDSLPAKGIITLPDYGNCRLIVRAYANHKRRL